MLLGKGKGCEFIFCHHQKYKFAPREDTDFLLRILLGEERNRDFFAQFNINFHERHVFASTRSTQKKGKIMNYFCQILFTSMRRTYLLLMETQMYFSKMKKNIDSFVLFFLTRSIIASRVGTDLLT